MRSFADSYSLRSVADLPAPFRSAFSFRYFNSLQSECFPCCFLSDINMVVSAPTGSGKTVLFELCILRLLSRFLSGEGKFNHTKGVLKTIYIAPSKALVQEKLRDWNMKLGSWGISCLEMTGDSESYNTKNIHEADIILSTPEKFDSMTRHGVRDGGLSFFSDIALILIDEVHLLNDPRGAALEAVVSRVKMLSRRRQMASCPLASVRFLAVSATIPNIDDLAEWLLVPSEGIKRFGEEMRPVKLMTKVFGYAPAKNDFLFEKRLQTFIFDILMQHSKGKSALIFCSTRKGAQEAAQHLSQIAASLGYSNPFIRSKQQQEKLKEASLTCSDKQMQSCILFGVGYHNGGLSLKDRNLIEGLFLKGDLQILCTTNTLAHGINLPAHTVVIKSTQYFNKEKGSYLEYERSMILQMCGRAGRPPFDDTGTVIIMTRRETVHLYENLLNGCEMVESQLLTCAMEHLNAEIVQLTVSDISLAIEWLKCSYLYVRIKKNPENYGIKRGIPCELLEKHMREPGRLMTKFYMKFGTMKDIVKAPEGCTLEDTLRIICHAEEIAWIQLRRNEKKLLNDINLDKESRLRFHILGEKGKKKKRIQTREEKIFVLVNDCLTGDPSVHDLSLSQDVNSICVNGCRISKCMKECFIYRKSYKGALNSTLLAKSLYQRLWDDSPYLLKQLPGIGMVTAKALQSAGISSFKTMEEADPRKIEIITGRKYPFGNHIKESLLSLPPKIEMRIEEAECRRQGKSKLVITLTRLSQSTLSSKQHYADMLVGSEEDNMILFHEKLRAGEFSSPYSVTVLVCCPQYGRVTVKSDLIFEEYVGVDVHEKHVITWEDNFNMTRAHKNQVVASDYSIPEEIYIVDDDHNSNSLSTSEKHSKSRRSEMVVASMPSFNLLEEETGEDPSTSEPAEIASKPTSEPGEAENRSKATDMIFDHIRKKSKNFPTLVTSRGMDASHQPLILTRRSAPKKQLTAGQSENSPWDSVILIDSEPTEASYPRLIDVLSSPVVAARQTNNISRSSRNVASSEHSVEPHGSMTGQLDRNNISSHNLKIDAQAIGCKRAHPLKSPTQASDIQGEKRCCLETTPSHHSEVSFLGFKSVFSFL